jgi:ubiquitin carboxyl-terminal hydrolase 9/13
MKLLKLPQILLIHLKRFKIDPTTYRYNKLGYRIPFSTEIRIETGNDLNKENLYKLKGVVIHCGQGLHYGHYYAMIRS